MENVVRMDINSHHYLTAFSELVAADLFSPSGFHMLSDMQDVYTHTQRALTISPTQTQRCGYF